MTCVAICGLGRMGSAIAERLQPSHDVRTWSRGLGTSPAGTVSGADVVLLSLFDGPACLDVLTACAHVLSAQVAVVNTCTVSPEEATGLERFVGESGARYVHAPVLGSTVAVHAGGLMILVGSEPAPEVRSVLTTLGEIVPAGNTPTAAGLKLVANGVLGDSLTSLRRALFRADAFGLPRDRVLDVLSRSSLGQLVEGKRELLAGGASTPAAFTVGALAKDLDLLAESTHSMPEASVAVDRLLTTGVVGTDDDIAAVATARQDLAWLRDARLDVSPEVVVDEDVLRPLHAYALTHATGNPAHLADAFLPTAHIEGYRDNDFTSWSLESYAALFSGPAADEPDHCRRVERVDVHGTVATAVMTLHHGETDFIDVFVLVRRHDGAWRIANKAYERRARRKKRA